MASLQIMIGLLDIDRKFWDYAIIPNVPTLGKSHVSMHIGNLVQMVLYLSQ